MTNLNEQPRLGSGAPTGGTGLDNPAAWHLCLCGARGCKNVKLHKKQLVIKK
jgi:hypothetical protein